MELNIERIVNSPINSNCFIIYKSGFSSCIILDPGSKDCSAIINFINSKNLIPEYIILTHEHFDHIWGVNELKSIYNLKIISSKLCNEKIVNRRKNLSIYYDQVGFNSCKADILIEDVKHKLFWNNHFFEFINTPGHSNGSICIYTNNILFTGDTLIKNEVTVTKLPGGNRQKLSLSLNKLIERFKDINPKVFSGHGDSFSFREIIKNKLLTK
jgi:hydroxyacylglutathione hydrolase